MIKALDLCMFQNSEFLPECYPFSRDLRQSDDIETSSMTQGPGERTGDRHEGHPGR